MNEDRSETAEETAAKEALRRAKAEVDRVKLEAALAIPGIPEEIARAVAGYVMSPFPSEAAIEARRDEIREMIRGAGVTTTFDEATRAVSQAEGILEALRKVGEARGALRRAKRGGRSLEARLLRLKDAAISGLKMENAMRLTDEACRRSKALSDAIYRLEEEPNDRAAFTEGIIGLREYVKALREEGISVPREDGWLRRENPDVGDAWEEVTTP